MNNEAEAGDETTSDGTYETSEGGTDSEVKEPQQEQQMPPQVLPEPQLNPIQTPLRLPFNVKVNNSWLEQQMHELLKINRR